MSLAIRSAPRLGGSALQVVHLAERELVGGHFAAGRVVDHVLGDLDRADDREVLRAALALVPVAREVRRRVDDDGPAAVLDPPERVVLGTQYVLAAPDRMILRKGTELVVLFREDLFHELLEAGVELAAAAASVGEDEAPLLDELPEVLPGQGVEFGGLVAVEVDDRRLKQLGNAGDRRDRRLAR